MARVAAREKAIAAEQKPKPKRKGKGKKKKPPNPKGTKRRQHPAAYPDRPLKTGTPRRPADTYRWYD